MTKPNLKITYHRNFLKSFRKRVNPNRKLLKKFQQRYDIFVTNPRHRVLQDHKLTGQLAGLRSFSVTGDIRVIYRFESENEIVFLDIGTHPQVYGK